MTHITHFRLQPANVQYWDYYILCRCNTEAAIALQRMEFWDGTKEDGNIHAEDINDVMEAQGQTPTQDTSRWIYKSADELHWELMGVSGERRLPGLLNFLIKEVKYLESRHHPTKGWDRRMQYQFQSKRIQDHINYLGYIISYFGLSLRRLCPVFYAIELLTSEKCRIEDLNAEKVLEKIETLKDAEKMPHFLKSTIEKFYQSFIKPPVRSFRNFAEWKLHSCGMQSAEMQNATGGIAESISQNCGSNNILHIISDDIEDRHKQITYAVLSDDKNSDTPASFSLQEMIAYVQANGYSVSQEPSTTKETLNGTAQPTYLAGDHRANGNDLAAVHPLSNLQGAARDPLGVATDQHQGDPSRTGTHTGQLADRVTTSDMPASSDAVTLETPLPSQAINDTGKNLPSQKTLSDASTDGRISQTEVTSQNEVVQASNGQSPIAAVATGNPDEEQATLSRSGENAPTESGAPAEAPKKPRKPAQPKQEKPTPPPIVLNAEEQAFYDLYCSMPWIKVAPKITANVKEHCGNLAPHLKTQEELYNLRKFMSGKAFFKGKGFHLPLVVMALNDWAMTQEPIDLRSERNGASKDTADRAGSTIMTPDPEKEAKLRAAQAALARLKEQEKAAQQYPGMRVAG